MELEFLLAPLGIALVVALSWWLGALKSTALDGPAGAIERFQIDFPAWQPVDVVVSGDEKTALLLFPDGVVGLVFTIGTKFGTRLWFWASHAVHHSSQHYNLTTALRQTWTGRIGLTFVFWLPLALIGFPPEMVYLFQGISLVYQFWIHTEQIGRMGPFE